MSLLPLFAARQAQILNVADASQAFWAVDISVPVLGRMVNVVSYSSTMVFLLLVMVTETLGCPWQLALGYSKFFA